MNDSSALSKSRSSEAAAQVVTIGGGTGTFVVLSGLRHVPGLALTAIVSSADDGGSTGRLRDAYGILPPGDARQALVALAEEGTLLRDLFAYRFSKGDVAGHNLGNLLITALADRLGSDAAALDAASRILRIEGRVLTASEHPATLTATLADGNALVGEHAIDERTVGRPRIIHLALTEPVALADAARSAIHGAQFIIMGPGDLYTSTIAPLLCIGMLVALADSSAKLVYVVNLFTKAGQTEGYTASEHVAEIERYVGRAIDHILIATGQFPEEALERYAEEGEHPVVDDLGGDSRVIRGAFAQVAVVEPVPEDPVPRSLIRHDSAKLATAITALL